MRKSLMTLFRRLLMCFGGLALLSTLVFLGANAWVLFSTRERIYPVTSCPSGKVGIVFGTSHWTRSGERNPHFEGRMEAAAELLRDGKIEHLLVSGDNATLYYNEPATMWRDLRGRGVREVDMTLDYAGFSTFDTLARARDVFLVEKAALITQSWHLPRALFIANALGLEAYGCAAEETPSLGVWWLKLREAAARVATVGDLYIWARTPRFLGPLEPLQFAPPVELAPNHLDKNAGAADIDGDKAEAVTLPTVLASPQAPSQGRGTQGQGKYQGHDLDEPERDTHSGVVPDEVVQ
ncbi:SanA/YdcF family protein [Halomonas binhaiensis]|nr:ElyC/SanA/YdcF family protein [Halomonas binhaiensis]